WHRCDRAALPRGCEVAKDDASTVASETWYPRMRPPRSRRLLTLRVLSQARCERHREDLGVAQGLPRWARADRIRDSAIDQIRDPIDCEGARRVEQWHTTSS